MATISSGTSQAAAIVTGLATVLTSCAPYANAERIRLAILEGADKYTYLNESIKSGRVINAYKSFENLCLNLVNDENVPTIKNPTKPKDEL